MPTGISEAESSHFIFSKYKGNDLYNIFLGRLGQLKFSELLSENPFLCKYLI